MEKKIRFVSGLRPTGKLHVGHYVGMLKQAVEMQNSGKYDCMVFIADTQALTDNAQNPEKIKESVKELMLDFLAAGLDPQKTTFYIQSQIPELSELTMYYSNLVTLSRLQRNPTVKTEIKQKQVEFGASVPVGFLTYPISQAADITAFDVSVLPVGEDQEPILEQTREIVRTFNKYYGETLVEPYGYFAKDKSARRLVGTDGNAKMSKSLDNCIYLADEPEEIRRKVMGMFTDPNHIKVSDPGNTKNNPVFIYLDIFGTDKQKIKEMKANYEKGGLGDMVCKKYLNDVMQEFLKPIRERRKYYEEHFEDVKKFYYEGSQKARQIARATLARVRKALKLEYFE
ncbi:MAG: tryptophan--tRNA ligase [Clostridia bacterium]|nr:tryptophan--tRNA ligase [Clostridia bacterium]